MIAYCLSEAMKAIPASRGQVPLCSQVLYRLLMRPAKADATWPTCQQPDCVGLTYAESDICVTHGTAENRVAALAELTRGEDCTWTRGLDIDEKLLTDIRNAVSQDNEGWPQFPSMDFAWATFHTDAQFSFSRFLRSAVFDGCAFLRRAEFGATHFTHGCSFGKAEFNGRAFFKQAKIQEQGRFEKAVFHDLAGFNIAAAGNMSFDGSDFEDMAVFSGSWSQASFRECQF